jgi:mannitol operon transcriptional antiterminator
MHLPLIEEADIPRPLCLKESGQAMMAFTTRQRDILKAILDVSRPISSVELAGLLNLTPRQVNYSIQGVRLWLRQHNHDLVILPGVGFAVSTSSEQARALVDEINLHFGVQIVLSVSQRQQLLALFLLSRSEPFILSQLEQIAQVSRVTLLKDLDEIESWLNGRKLNLIRKPHFGIQVSGAEHDRQQALAEVLWNETPFSGDPVTAITHVDGLVFNLRADAALLPLVKHINDLFAEFNIRRTIGLVAKSEEQLGGRFTDDAVLHLALVFAILARRVRDGYHLEMGEQLLSWLQSAKIWPVASYVSRHLGRDTNSTWKPADVAGVAMEMLAAPRNEILPGELERNGEFSVLNERLMETISQVFEIPKMKHDRTLQNGLLNNIVPACYRQRFNLWFPVALNNASLPEQHEREYGIAQEVARMVHDYTGSMLPQSEINNLVVLLRAAFIRNRTYRFERIIVVCPSGMATAQLLIARLNARFPYLNKLEVTSLRDLTPALVASADLILTTVPLPKQYADNSKTIKVHPLLMPEDIEAITQFLS